MREGEEGVGKTPRFPRPRERKRVLSTSQASPKESTVPAGLTQRGPPTHGAERGAGQPTECQPTDSSGQRSTAKHG